MSPSILILCLLAGTSSAYITYSQLEAAPYVANKFVNAMSDSLQSRKPALIAKHFDYNFMFKLCGETYTKGQTVAMINSLPKWNPRNPAASVIITLLVGAKWTEFSSENGRIEFSAQIHIPNTEIFVANFVICPDRNVVISGSAERCPKKKGVNVF
ncbi:hypothetical protein B9Z55_025278 [Caenorhabditis nigoni]|uniref:NTF2-like domain-containing protein n=1 Tax=Caenorhabditis nigoni TaxID=1611254 RepID=A0A2G5SXP4_9PELO|nr:hypothetical protein B9Z55_025278 [Caenorhabditis nigoni]